MIDEKEALKELTEAYDQLSRDHQQLMLELIQLKQDSWKDRFNILERIIEHEDLYPKDIVKLAIWHLKKMLSKHGRKRDN